MDFFLVFLSAPYLGVTCCCLVLKLPLYAEMLACGYCRVTAPLYPWAVGKGQQNSEILVRIEGFRAWKG